MSKEAKFVVLVDSNFHFMNEDERYEAGSFSTVEEAFAKCRRIVDEELEHFLKFGTPPDDLYEQWTIFGDDPFVQGAGFNAREYAEKQCELLVESYKTRH